MLRALPAVLVVVAATAASAQYPGGGGGMGGRGGGMGGGRGGPGGMGRAFEAPPNPSAKDVEKHDPVKLLLDKHKKLELDKTRLHSAIRAHQEEHSPLDSLVEMWHRPLH